MKKLYVVLVLGLAVGVVCWAFGPSVISAKDTEVKVKIEELPAAVKATLNGFIEKEAPGAKIEEIEKEVEDGKVIYDVELEAGDKDVELEIAEDGTLIEQEVDEEKEEKEGEEGDEEDKDDGVTVTLGDLPDAVQATVTKEAQSGEIGEIEKEEEDGEVVYDVDVKIDGKKFELKIAADGKLLKKEADEDEDGDEEDDDNDGDEE